MLFNQGAWCCKLMLSRRCLNSFKEPQRRSQLQWPYHKNPNATNEPFFRSLFPHTFWVTRMLILLFPPSLGIPSSNGCLSTEETWCCRESVWAHLGNRKNDWRPHNDKTQKILVAQSCGNCMQTYLGSWKYRSSHTSLSPEIREKVNVFEPKETDVGAKVSELTPRATKMLAATMQWPCYRKFSKN